MEGRFATSRHLCGGSDSDFNTIYRTLTKGLGVLMLFRQKNESLASKSKLLSKRQLALVPTANESVSSFRFTFPQVCFRFALAFYTVKTES